MAKNLPITIELTIPKHPKEILSFTKEVLGNILSHRDLDKSQQQRIKLILIELVTNTIKHACGADSQIRLLIDHLTLTIHKLEKGMQIEFVSSGQQIPLKSLIKPSIFRSLKKTNTILKPWVNMSLNFYNPFVKEVLIIFQNISVFISSL